MSPNLGQVRGGIYPSAAAVYSVGNASPDQSYTQHSPKTEKVGICVSAPGPVLPKAFPGALNNP